MDAQERVNDDPIALRPKASDWLWRPRIAKTWWFAIPIYWSIKLASLWVKPFDVMNEPGWFGYLNILFFPPLVLMILGVGWVRALIDDGYIEIVPLHGRRHERGPSGLPCHIDPLDPRSGMMWIGNRDNPRNAIRKRDH